MFYNFYLVGSVAETHREEVPDARKGAHFGNERTLRTWFLKMGDLTPQEGAYARCLMRYSQRISVDYTIEILSEILRTNIPLLTP